MTDNKINKILLFSLGIVFSLTIAEFSLRLLGYLYDRQRSSKEITRVQEIAVDKTRIVCLGDSNTYGTGAIPGYSYPEQLQRMLDKDKRGKYKVYNLALPAANSSMLLKRLTEWIRTYQPSIIIVLIGVNDNWNFSESNYHLVYRGMGAYLYRLESWLGKLRLYKLIKIALSRKKDDAAGAGLRGDNAKVIDEGLKNKIKLCSGYCYEQVDYHKAEALAKEILSEDPNNDIAYQFLADITFDFDLEKAIVFLKKALELNPYNREVRLRLFDAYRRNENYLESREQLKRIIELFPAEADIMKIYKVGLPSHDDQDFYTRLLSFNFKKMAELSNQADAVLMFLSYPFGNDPFLLRAIEIVKEKYNLPYCDNRNLIDITDQNRDYYYWSDERHFNENGYYLLAQNVFNKIKELNLDFE